MGIGELLNPGYSVVLEHEIVLGRDTIVLFGQDDADVCAMVAIDKNSKSEREEVGFEGGPFHF